MFVRAPLSWMPRTGERQARHDPLTGVGNYRQLHERLQEIVVVDVERFALLTMDVDSRARSTTHVATLRVTAHCRRSAAFPE